MTISIQSYEDPETVVLDASLIDQLTRGNIIDAPITLLREDPPLWVLPTAMQQNGDIFLSHTLLRGYLGDLSDAEYMVVNEHDLFLIPNHLQGRNNGRHWITNLFHTGDGILAFLHSEYTGKDDFFGMPSIMIRGKLRSAPGRSAISLAWLPQERLDDDIFQFDFLGNIAAYCSDISHFNVSGTPVFENTEDGETYLNILFNNTDVKNDQRVFVSQARAPLKEVLDGAKTGNLTAWTKKNGDKWSDSLGKGATSVLPTVEGHPDDRIARGALIVHSDVRYFPEIEKYILVTYTLIREPNPKVKEGSPSHLVIFSSQDGLIWNFEMTSSDRKDGSRGWSYVTLLREGRRDKSKSPYLLVGWEYGKSGRSVYRLNMQIEGV